MNRDLGRRALPAEVGWLAAALVLTTLLYAVAMTAPFILDDEIDLLPAGAQSLRGFWTAFTSLDSTEQRFHLRPILFLSFALNRELIGSAPWAYRIVNLALHLGSSVLVFAGLGRALRSADPDRRVATFAACFFALHPLAAEVVVQPSRRAAGLGGFFLLLAAWAYLAARETRKGRHWLGAVVAFAASLLTYETGVAFVAFVLLFEGVQRVPWKQALLRVAPFAAVVTAWLAIRVALTGHVVAQISNAGTAGPFAGAIGPLDYALTQLPVHVMYLAKLVIPYAQYVHYPLAAESSLANPAVAASAGLLLAVVAVVAVTAWRFPSARPGVLVGLGWYGAHLLPTSSVVPLLEFAAERRVYAASFVIAAALAWLARAMVARAGDGAGAASRRTQALVAAGVVYLGVLAALNLKRQVEYVQEFPIWEDIVNDFPTPPNERTLTDPGLAQINLALAHVRHGATMPALGAFEAACRAFSAYGCYRAGDLRIGLRLENPEGLLARSCQLGMTSGCLLASEWLESRGDRKRAEAVLEIACRAQGGRPCQALTVLRTRMLP